MSLLSAATKGDLGTVVRLVRGGANVHNNGEEALRYAAQKGHLSVVQFLVPESGSKHSCQ